MIYVIGDSHVAFFSKDRDHYEILPYPDMYDSNPEGYKIIRVDVMISAYAIKDNIEKIDEILSKFTITNEDYIVFSFGEIDMRYYLTKDVNEEKDPMISFEASLESYKQFLQNMKTKYSNIIVFAPVPQFIEQNQLNGNTGFLDRETRDKYTIQYNERLTGICKELNINIIDLREYIMKDGVPNGEYYHPIDHIHITNECMTFFELEFNKLKNMS